MCIRDRGNPDAPPSKLFSVPLIAILSSTNEEVAESAAKAIAKAMSIHQDMVGKTIDKLIDSFVMAYPTLYEEEKKVEKGGGKKGVKSMRDLEDQFVLGKGGKKSAEEEAAKDNEQKQKLRFGVCLALAELGDPSNDVPIDSSQLSSLINFLTLYGLADRDDSVRGFAVDAGRKIVTLYLSLIHI